MIAATVLGRPAETRAVAAFVRSTSAWPSGCVLEGEAGIGKTTVWLAAVDAAVGEGIRVVSARAAEAESVLAYAALADLLGDVDSDLWARIPTPQRLALDRVLLRGNAVDVVTDPRLVAAGFLSLIERLEKTAPVLLAIDDLQWLDSSSRQVIAFAVRRLSGRVGVLATVRNSLGSGGDPSWLQLHNLAEVHRIPLGPLSLGGLRAVVSERLGRSFSRLAMVRMYDVSRGNPFYALELARVVGDGVIRADVGLPGSLAELVRRRMGSLPVEVQSALLAASCLSAPTVELVARATGHDAHRVVNLLADAEDKGIVSIDGHRLNFTHPLLARGVYA